VIVAAIIILVFGAVSLQNFIRGQQAAQATAQAVAKVTAMAATFGANNLARCDNLTQIEGGQLDSTARIVVVNSTSSQVADDYQAAVPTANRATSSTDLTDVVCVRTSHSVFAEDSYGDKNSQVTVYRCTRYVVQIEAFVIDAHTGQPIAYRSYDGSDPPTCPDQTDTDLSEYGSTPKPSTVISGLFNISPGPGQV
jgi:uncharacterized protein (DUF1330 family)